MGGPRLYRPTMKASGGGGSWQEHGRCVPNVSGFALKNHRGGERARGAGPSAWMRCAFAISTSRMSSDVWDDAGGNIVEHIADIDDLETAMPPIGALYDDDRRRRSRCVRAQGGDNELTGTSSGRAGRDFCTQLGTNTAAHRLIANWRLAAALRCNREF